MEGPPPPLSRSLSLSLPFCFSLSLPLHYILRCTASWGKCPLLFCIPHSAKQTEEIHSLCLYLHNEWSRCHSSTLAAYWVLGAASLAAWSHRLCQAFQRLARTMKDKSKERSTSMGRATLLSLHFFHLFLRQLHPDHQRSYSASLDSQILIHWHCQFSCKVLQEARGGIYPSVRLSVKPWPCNSPTRCRLQDFLSNNQAKIHCEKIMWQNVKSCITIHTTKNMSYRQKKALSGSSWRWTQLSILLLGVKSWQTSGSLPNEDLKEVYNGGDAFD